MEIKQYAPVLIPTLNRYEHFKRCLESLERCTGADKTDVYIGLDFPPSDKYRKGWEKIDLYLKEKETTHGFKNLYVRRRGHNCGVGKDGSNANLLRKEIEEKYEYYISTEDDNEFSPCFLEYMNKCLVRFKDDTRINLVCGYNYVMDFPESYKNNFYITKWGCPWGTGQWISKLKLLRQYYSLEKIAEIIKTDETYYLLKRRYPQYLVSAINMLKDGELHGDAIKGIYATINDTYCVLPRESMVRNHGNDGTGEHSKKMNDSQNVFYAHQPISQESSFEFTDDIFTYEPVYLERRHYVQKMNLFRWLHKMHSNMCFKIDIFLFRKFNYLPKSRWI